MPEPEVAPRSEQVAPLSYASTSASEMQWVVRFVACYMGAPLLATLVTGQLQYLSVSGTVGYPRDWREILYLLPTLLGLAAAIGGFFRWRVGLWGMIILPLVPSEELFYVPDRYEAFLLCLEAWAVGVFPSLVTWFLYRRAERAGVLLPPRRDRAPEAPSSNDILWLVRCVGLYALSVPLGYVILHFLDRLSTLRGFDPMELPRHMAVTAISIALVSMVAIPTAFGRWRMLLALAIIYLASPVAGFVANRYDLAASARFRGMPALNVWPVMVVAIVYGLARAVPLVVLYLRARRGRGAA